MLILLLLCLCGTCFTFQIDGYQSLINDVVNEVLDSPALADKLTELRVDNFIPKEDFYACRAFPVLVDEYITKYEALSDSDKAHHIIVFGCKSKPNHSQGGVWQCNTPCSDAQIVYAWAKNAHPTELPKDTGFHIGGNSGINYLVIQIHYSHGDTTPDNSGVSILTTKVPPRYLQGILLMAASALAEIPPHKNAHAIDVSCRFDGNKPIHAFAFRTHAHDMARVISAYRTSAEKPQWELLGKGNPQWPQAFYPMSQGHTIYPNDILAARCVFNSTGKNSVVHIGNLHTDEMCNFYMMYYVEGAASSYYCTDNRLPLVTATLPEDSMLPLPPNPMLDETASGHHHSMDNADHSMDNADHSMDNADHSMDNNDHQEHMRLEQRSGTRTELRIPYFKPTTEDFYACTSFKVDKESFITQYEALADADTAHHILLFGCPEVQEAVGSVWSCSSACSDSKILYAWAKNARPTKLPENVGFHIGGDSKVNYLVMQIHYVQPLTREDNSGLAIQTITQPPKYRQGVLLLMNGMAQIPPNQPVVAINVSCHFPGSKPIHPFAYRTHAHTLSRVITAYRKSDRESKWEMLGKGNPRWPQAFYPMTEPHTIYPNDTLAATCVYDSIGTSTATSMGATHNDEMCNFYMMYYVEGPADFYECFYDEMPEVTATLPRSSLEQLPPNPLLDEMANSHHHHGMAGNSASGNMLPSGHVHMEMTEPPLSEQKKGSSPINSGRQELRIPFFKPTSEDFYACTAFKVDKEAYITQYEALADADTAHHILLFGCPKVQEAVGSVWQCDSACSDSQILYAWARNADPTKLPKDVGFHIGGDSKVNYLVMQIHYVQPLTREDNSGLAIQTTSQATKYLQGVLLMVNSVDSIPPNKEVVAINISCDFTGSKPIHPFAYRTHAHTLSRVITAYRKSGGVGSTWEMLGKGNPRWPQAFYPMKEPHTINPNDILAATCVYNSIGATSTTSMGATHNDEMCNFYMMYYVEGPAKFYQCVNDGLSGVAATLPRSVTEQLPPNPLLDAMASGHHHHGMGSDHEGHSVNMGSSSQQFQIDGHDIPYLSEAEIWFKAPDFLNLGQVAGIDIDSQENVVLFHRGSFAWDVDTFDISTNIYTQKDKGPIKEKTLVRLDRSGKIVNPEEDTWGDNMFYMPHGLTIDEENNIWITDVALHQVMKFPAGEKRKASLTLGVAFVPGSDEEHFCKPTDVAVTSDGNFYVSDGYCNSRIMMYNKQGQILRKWGSEGEGSSSAAYKFSIPHSLTISKTLGLLCVADRENSRIQCFDLEGQHKFTQVLNMKPFAISFRAQTDKLLAAEADDSLLTGQGELLRISPQSASSMAYFNPKAKKFGELHDIAINKEGTVVYIAQVQPPAIWKFVISINDAVNTEEHHHHHDDDDDDDEHHDHHMDSTGLSSIHKPILSSSDKISVTFESQKVPIIVAVLLVVPVVVVLLFMLGYKINSCRKNRQVQGKFDMGNIFSSRVKKDEAVAFTPLTSQEDHYTEDDDDEDIEAAEKRKILPKK